ncbi:hypothetical protein BGW80DRAFT_1372321, partial [Lactifluus volemus]
LGARIRVPICHLRCLPLISLEWLCACFTTGWRSLHFGVPGPKHFSIASWRVVLPSMASYSGLGGIYAHTKIKCLY